MKFSARIRQRLLVIVLLLVVRNGVAAAQHPSVVAVQLFAQTPLQQAPLQQAPLQQAPLQQAPLQQAPLQQAPLQQTPQQHLIDSLASFIKTAPATTEKVDALNRLARVSFHYSIQTQKQYASEALDLAKQLSYTKGIARAMSYLSQSSEDMGASLQALNEGQLALQLAAQVGDSLLLAEMYNNISSSYRQRLQYDSAMLYARRAMEISLVQNDSLLYAQSLGNFAQVFSRMGKYDDAKHYLEQILPIFRRANDGANEATTLLRLGYLSGLQADYQNELRYCKEALALNERFGFTLQTAYSHSQVGSAHLHLQQYDDAIRSLNVSLQFADSLGLLAIRQEIFSLLSKVYEAKGDAPKALSYYKQFVDIIQRINADSRAVQILQLSSSEQRAKEQEILLLQREAAAEKTTRIYLTIVMVLLIVTVVVAGYGYMITQARKKERELFKQEERYKLLAENVSDVIALHKPDGTYLYVSPSVQSMAGFTPEELIGRNPYEFLHPDDTARIRSGVHETVLREHSIESDVVRMLTKSGEYIWVEAIVRPIYGNETEPSGVYITSTRNVTARTLAEQELAESKDNLNKILDTMAVGASVNHGTKIVFVNNALCEMVGYTKEEIFAIEKPFALVHPDDYEKTMTYSQKRLRGEFVPSVYEVRFVHKSGSVVWIELSAFVIHYENKPALMATYMNITARKKAEEQLRASEEALRATIEFSPMVSVQWFNIKGEILLWNDASEYVFGWRADEALGKTLDQLIHTKEDTEAFRKTLEEIHQTGMVTGPTEYTFRKKNGELGYAISTIFAITSMNDEPRFVCMDVDTTEQKRLENALRESEERFRSIVEAMSEGLIVQDDNDAILFSNSAAETILGLTREQLYGRSSYDPRWRVIREDGSPFGPDDRPSAYTLRTGEPRANVMMGVYKPDGTLSWILTNSQPMRATIKSNGLPSSVVMTFTDITKLKETELAFRRSEEQFRSVVDAMSEGMTVQDQNSTIIFANPAAGRILGVPFHQMVGRSSADPLWRAVDEDGQPLPGDNLPSAITLQTGHPQIDVTMGVHKPNNEITWMLVNARPIFAGHPDTPSSVVVTFSDITKRREAQIALRERERQLTALIESTQDTIYSIDKNYRLLIYNSAYKTAAKVAFGVELALGMDVMTLLPEAFASERAAWKNTFDRAFSGEQFSLVYSPPFLAEQTYSEQMFNPIRDERGNIVGVVAFNRDITNIKRAEEQLRKSELFLKQTGDIAKVGGWELDFSKPEIRTNWTDATFGIYEIETGVPPDLDDAIGFYPESIRPKVRAVVEKTIAEGSSFDFESPFITAKGKYIWVRALGNTEQKDGKTVRLYGTIQNITEQKQTALLIQQQLTALEAKTAEMERFIYTVSHDLKSPLITIKGFLGMITHDILEGNTERARKDLLRIDNAATKMQHLLEDLLELSRVGRVINPSERFSMTALALETVELLHGILQAKNVSVSVAPAMPFVLADKARFREVYQNLIENAVKFMGDEPTPHIELGVQLDDIEPIFFVRDNGIGIDKQYHDTIFGLFDKLDQKSEGTGIGLALVKRIVELHGGRIWVESERGGGATFYFSCGSAANR